MTTPLTLVVAIGFLVLVIAATYIDSDWWGGQ